MEGPGQPKGHGLVVLGWETGERKSFSSEAKQQNMPKILTVGARDQERFTGETSGEHSRPDESERR